jgi:hypothetical protein
MSDKSAVHGIGSSYPRDRGPGQAQSTPARFLKDNDPMKKLLVTIALGATIASTHAIAQPADAQGDQTQGQLTRQQAMQMADAMFQRFDLNHDGVITRDEAEQARAQLASSGKGSGRAERMIDRMFGDGQSVTQGQFEALALARFDKRDLNHDGLVTPDERGQARDHN